MNNQLIEEIEHRFVSKLVKQSDPIVISGLAGRLPMSNNMNEFSDNLFNNIDMVTNDMNEERWPRGKSYIIRYIQIQLGLPDDLYENP